MTQEQINKLKEFKTLLDTGVITAEEFEKEKAKIMGTYVEPNNAPQTEQEPTPQADGNEQLPQTPPQASVPLVETTSNGTNGTPKTPIKKFLPYIIGGAILLLILIIAIGRSGSRSSYSDDYDYHASAVSTITINNTSKDPYKIYVNGFYEKTLEGKSSMEIEVEPGWVKIKAEQQSGYVFKATVNNREFKTEAYQSYTCNIGFKD